MERKITNYLKTLFALTFISLLLVFALLLWDIVFIKHTPTYIIPIAPTTDAEIRLQSLEEGLQSLQRDLVFQLNRKLYFFGGIALLISGTATFFGWRTFKDLDALIQGKIRATLENELYQLDPANLTIRVPKRHLTTNEIIKRLEISGLKKLKTYPELNKSCLYGLTIVPVESPEDEKEYLKFLKDENPDPDNAAFVLYSTSNPREFRISLETINQFPRSAIANMPSTVITAILAIARGLHREINLEKKENQEGL